MRKLIILIAFLALGMSANAQMKTGQVFTIDQPIKITKIVSNKSGTRVVKEKIVKQGRDVIMYLTLENKTILTFKNGYLIGGIK